MKLRQKFPCSCYSWTRLSPRGGKFSCSHCDILTMVAHIGRVTVFVWFCCVIVGTLRDDSLYLFETIKKASSGPENAVNFDYHLGHLPVCRDAFFQFLGLPTLSTRALSYETMIRQGVQALPERKVADHIVYGDGMQDIARQYIHAHVVVHAEKSPSHPIFSAGQAAHKGRLPRIYRLSAQ